MGRQPTNKTAEWRRFLSREDAARIAAINTEAAALDAARVNLTEERRRLVARAQGRWQYEKRKRKGFGRKS